VTSSDQLWERVGVECITKWGFGHLQISSPAVFRAGRRSGIGLSQITLSQKEPLPLSKKLQRKSVHRPNRCLETRARLGCSRRSIADGRSSSDPTCGGNRACELIRLLGSAHIKSVRRPSGCKCDFSSFMTSTPFQGCNLLAGPCDVFHLRKCLKVHRPQLRQHVVLLKVRVRIVRCLETKNRPESLLAGKFSNFFWRVHFGKLNASNRSSSAGEFSGI
jgi:hypothetical protein